MACSRASKVRAGDARGQAPRLDAHYILNACSREGLSELLLDKVEGVLDTCAMPADRYHKPLPQDTDSKPPCQTQGEGLLLPLALALAARAAAAFALNNARHAFTCLKVPRSGE